MSDETRNKPPAILEAKRARQTIDEITRELVSYRVVEVARLLGMSRLWVLKMIKTGQLSCYVIGNQYRVTAKAIIKFQNTRHEIHRQEAFRKWHGPRENIYTLGNRVAA